MCLTQHRKAVVYKGPLKTSDSSVGFNSGTTSEIAAIINPNFYNCKGVAEKSCKLLFQIMQSHKLASAFSSLF